mgnify:CR=1 FL=1
MTNKINNIKSYISFSLVQNKVLSKECYLLANLNNKTNKIIWIE